MGKSIFIVFFFFCSFLLQGQNLVPNPSFEQLSSCPNKYFSYSELNIFCPPWLAPTQGSPDIFSTCNTDTLSSVPKHSIELSGNTGFYFCNGYQQPRTGNGYLRAVYLVKRNIRENFQVELLKKLEKNKKYYIGFYTSLSDCSGYAIAAIGALLTKDTIRNYDNINIGKTATLFFPEPIPQIINKNGILNDTAHWIEISDTYKAKGGEHWLTIGCFKHTIEEMEEYDTLQDDYRAQYYFDDIFVYELESIVSEDSICLGDSTALIANSKSSYYWSSDVLGADTLSLDSIYWVQPTITTQYFLIAQTFTDSLTLTVVKPPTISLPTHTIKCSNQTIQLSVPSGYSTYLWNTVSTDTAIIADTVGRYTVIVTNAFSCTTLATTQLQNYPYTLPNLGKDTILCLEEVSLQLSAPPNAQFYDWLPFGETDPSITVIRPAQYSVIITDTNNCVFTDSIFVKQYCDYPAWFPNAFTPDSKDTLNSVFKPLIYNVGEYTLQIYNRWGENVFESHKYTLGWNGKHKGKPCIEGVYFFKINYTEVVGGRKQKYTKNGVVHLLR